MSKETSYVHRTKPLKASIVQSYKKLKVWMQCLCRNVVDCLFVVTSLSTNDRRSETLRLDTNPLALIRDKAVH